MGPRDLLITVAERLERLDIRYFVSGSMASMLYGEQRNTRDVDIVLSIGPQGVRAIVGAFTDDAFYVDEASTREAIERFDQFNVIHLPTGLKIDFMVVDEDGFDASRFSRRRRFEVAEGQEAWFAAPEDVILKKLMYYKEGRSEKHLRDIASMFKVSGDQFDRPYLDHWATRLGVLELWNYIVARVEGREPGPSV